MKKRTIVYLNQFGRPAPYSEDDYFMGCDVEIMPDEWEDLMDWMESRKIWVICPYSKDRITDQAIRQFYRYTKPQKKVRIMVGGNKDLLMETRLRWS